MANHLSGGCLNVSLLREAARRELLQCLDCCNGSKALVWDECLIGPFGLIAEYALLKEHEVTRMFPLQNGVLPQCNVQNVIFLTRPELTLMDAIAKCIRNDETRAGHNKEFHLIFAPRKSMLCEKRLQDLGVYGNLATVAVYSQDFFAFDNDLLSMEIKTPFKCNNLWGPRQAQEDLGEADISVLYQCARALITLQTVYGVIPNIYGKGKSAQVVHELMQRFWLELAGGAHEPQSASQIDNLVLIDRSVDMITPLVTQLTYEGLIDEVYSINNTSVKLPPEKFVRQDEAMTSPAGGDMTQSALQSGQLAGEHKSIVLNSADELYSEIRDKNFNAVGPALSRKAKIISAQFEERHGARTVGEIKQFVAKLPHMQAAKQSLANHTAIAELIREVTDSDKFLESLQTEQEFLNCIETDRVNGYIEDCIGRQEPVVKVLRLICLQSLANSGLKQKIIDHYKREIIQTYDYSLLLSLQALEQSGLIRVQSSPRYYSTVRKTLRLTVDQVNEQNPTDISYVHSGYAPLSVRLVQYLFKPGWKCFPDIDQLIPGPTIEHTQHVPRGLRKRRGSGSSSYSSSGNDEQKLTLVFFLGGCTYSEISALRFLSQQDDAPTEYVIATTQMINGTSFIKSFIDTDLWTP